MNFRVGNAILLIVKKSVQLLSHSLTHAHVHTHPGCADTNVRRQILVHKEHNLPELYNFHEVSHFGCLLKHGDTQCSQRDPDRPVTGFLLRIIFGPVVGDQPAIHIPPPSSSLYPNGAKHPTGITLHVRLCCPQAFHTLTISG